MLCDTQWEFVIPQYTEKEFDAIRKNSSIIYLIMAQMPREDGDGYDLHGYMEFGYTLDAQYINGIEEFKRAELTLAIDYPEEYAMLFKSRWLCTERGIRSDIIMEMAKHIGTNTDDCAELRKTYGAQYFSVWEAERKKQEAQVQAMKEKNFDLRPWQRKVIEMLESQSDGAILYVEAEEGAGKTALAKYLRSKYKAYAASNSLSNQLRKSYQREPFVVIDTQSGKTADDVLVEMKSGKMHDTAKMKSFKPPKILVMARSFCKARTTAGLRCRKVGLHRVVNDDIIKILN